MQFFACLEVLAQGNYPKTYEAENSALSGVAGTGTNHPNYSGSGFVDNFIAANASSTISNLYANEGGTYYLLEFY